MTVTILILVLIAVILYRKKGSAPAGPKDGKEDRRAVLDYVNERSVDLIKLREAARRLFPSTSDSLAVCGLKREDVTPSDYCSYWTVWPEGAHTIHYRNTWGSDRLLFSMVHFAKEELVVHLQYLDCVTGDRRDEVSRVAYDMLDEGRSGWLVNQYRTKSSNVYPNSQVKDKYVQGKVVQMNWFEIPRRDGEGNFRMWLSDNDGAERVREGIRKRKAMKAKIGTVEGRYDPMAALESMTGLESVKEEVRSLRNYIQIQKARREAGLPTSDLSLHSVFMGNPGTGKTTVARIVAGIYHEAGLLPTANLVETDRAGLVAGYIGQTAPKTGRVIDSAMGGVLFIDEAYTLHSDSGQDFGHEAIATLLKRMEDDRGKFAVILAGYTGNMKEFMNDNPGLKSRFSRQIEFPDYTIAELEEIFLNMAKTKGYHLTEDGRDALRGILERDVAEKDEKFGNGRHVRNIFERSIQRQADRLGGVLHPSVAQLTALTADDIG